ncbi:hypothetical protein U9M48_041665, partial [Paspalum notatum var. saurae]
MSNNIHLVDIRGEVNEKLSNLNAKKDKRNAYMHKYQAKKWQKLRIKLTARMQLPKKKAEATDQSMVCKSQDCIGTPNTAMSNNIHLVDIRGKVNEKLSNGAALDPAEIKRQRERKRYNSWTVEGAEVWIYHPEAVAAEEAKLQVKQTQPCNNMQVSLSSNCCRKPAIIQNVVLSTRSH